MMGSACIQSNIGGSTTGYESPHIMDVQTPQHVSWQNHMVAQQHNITATATIVKQEPIDHDSSAYGSGSDCFHSSSPGGSDQNSRESNPSHIPTYTTNHNMDNIQLPLYYSTPIANRVPVSTIISYQHAGLHGFNPLTPPGFEPMVSPKTHTQTTSSTQHLQKNESFQPTARETNVNATLTPCTTPPSGVTPPKSPKNDISMSENEDVDGKYYEEKPDGEDHLRRLQMAFERNDMLPGSPKSKSSDAPDSIDDEDKSDYEMDEVDEQGLRVPRVNSHGKVKTFKCKQCDFIAVTKLDFWEHTRAHIKTEKLLTCPKCPFVTEYKHHLEYHLRNHFGSKPFKCDKCSYSCVNKSMLNSHLKSHSNIYQYRCSDCTYATKYCHSLKLHLRKYKHNPAMVLNPDGTPNPLPIIDVYGTRRGPKQKPKSDSGDEASMLTTPSTGNFPPQSIFPHFLLNSQQPNLPIPFPYGPLLGAFPGALNNPLLFPQINPGQTSPTPSNDRSTPDSLKIDEDPIDTTIKNNNNDEIKEDSQLSIHKPEDDSAALDLSKPEISLPITVPEIRIQTPIIASNASSKNRRKGRAFKLERISVAKDVFSEDDEDLEEKKIVSEKSVSKSTNDEDKDTKVPDAVPKSKSDIFNCQYCDIAFKDVVMYTMHMGYHGYKDPFTCNMCGEQSADKVSFFLHIARTSHS